MIYAVFILYFLEKKKTPTDNHQFISIVNYIYFAKHGDIKYIVLAKKIIQVFCRMV